MSTARAMWRYSAFLLFQFRVEKNGQSNRRRLCERRLIVFKARGNRSARAHANQRGREAELSYQNGYGATVHFEFVGVQDVLELGPECEPDEVWYEMFKMVRPMERYEQLRFSGTRLPGLRLRRPGKRRRT
jgi:hypothetical protein